jgi:hypothetical protein
VVNKYGCQATGFRTTQCPGSMAQNKWVLQYMYKSTQKELSCGRQWQLLDNIQLP